MRTPASKSYRGQKASTTSIPAPIGGWNARDSIAAMDPKDAYRLINWFPRPGDIMTRLGYEEYATGIDGAGSPPTSAQVETIAVYRPTSGAQEMFAFADEYIYDATGGGAATPVVSGLTGAQWETINFTTAGGNFLICVNGEDEMELYDGSTWENINALSTPSITNVSTDDLSNINVHKQRVWYIGQGSLSAWYSAAGAFAGALTEFPLGGVFSKGGTLVAMGTWTMDGGSGMDDLAVFITDQGEVAVYQGVDPSNINDWQLVGVYTTGKPIGKRCMFKYGGDLLIITTDGVVSCNRSYGGEVNPTAMTDKVQGAMAEAANLYKTNLGWQLTHYPEGTMLILNVPVNIGVQEQYVMNTVSGAWCKFTGWAANCFAIYNDDLYFGGDGVIARAWSGKSDNGDLISCEVMPAFNYFKNRTGLKHWKMIRPNIARDVNPNEFLLGFDVDFNVNTPTSGISFAPTTGALWDVAEWDIDVWSGGLTVGSNWQSITGVGYTGTPHIIVKTNSATIFVNAFDYVYSFGGIL